MRVAYLAAAMAAFVTSFSGCQKDEPPAAPEPAAGSNVPVVHGMQNELFTAASAREITLEKGTTVTPVTDPDGKVRTVVLARDNAQGMNAWCGCGTGCSEGAGGGGLNIGCVTVTQGGQIISCSGECSAKNMSCAGCSIWYAQPQPGSTHAHWIRRKDLNQVTITPK